ncbi:MAG TPA: hypothetical protein VEX13_12555 [Chloroflexia bacterium]|nr:hypothetical protein [Chloroflexia bacterium]
MAITAGQGKHRRQPMHNRTGSALKVAQAAPVSPLAGETIQQTIEQELQTMLQALCIIPSGPVEVLPLQHCDFQILSDRVEFEITLPSPLSSGNHLSVPVTTDVQWEVLNEEGETILPGDAFTIETSSVNTLGVQIVFFPRLVKDEAGAPHGVAFTLRASVSATAIHPTTGEEITMPAQSRVSLSPVTVTVPVALRIPSILAFFPQENLSPQAANESSLALVFVPPDSRLERLEDLADGGVLATLMEKVGALRAAIEALPVAEQSLMATLAGNLEGLLDGLATLLGNLARFSPPYVSPDNVRLERSKGYQDIGELIHGRMNYMEGEYRLGSLVFVGLEETTVLCNRRQFHDDRSIVQIELGSCMYAVIDKLDGVTPTIRAGDATISTIGPASFIDMRMQRSDTFGDAVASFHFGKNPW